MSSSWATDGFARLRFGIGKPEGPNAKERVVGLRALRLLRRGAAALEELIDRAADVAERWSRDGLATAMNRFNRR